MRDNLGPYLAQHYAALAEHPLVGEAQTYGLMGALQLVRDKTSGACFDAEQAVGMLCRGHCFENGLIMRAVGDRMIAAIRGYCSAARRITARSCGEVIDSQPGPSSPDGDDAFVARAPTRAALRFIAATATCEPPSMSASMFAASFPDTISSPESNCRVV